MAFVSIVVAIHESACTICETPLSVVLARRATAAGVSGAAGGGEAGQRVRQGGVPLVHGVRRLRSPAGRCVLSGGRGRYGHVAFAARACRLVHVRG